MSEVRIMTPTACRNCPFTENHGFGLECALYNKSIMGQYLEENDIFVEPGESPPEKAWDNYAIKKASFCSLLTIVVVEAV